MSIRPDSLLTKDPDDIEVYEFDWSRWLKPGASIASSTWTLSGSGLTQDNDGISGGMTTVRLSGGDLGTTYVVTNRITTDESPSQRKQRSFRLAIVDQ